MKLCIFPHPALREKARTLVSFSDPAIDHTIQALRDLIQFLPHGIGAAAPQVGVNLQIAIVDLRSRDPKAQELILINPVIHKASMVVMSREGCMSIPDYRADIQRYKKIEMTWQGVDGREHAGSFEGIQAICIQHEVDHLNGMLFIDRVTCLKRDLIPRKR